MTDIVNKLRSPGDWDGKDPWIVDCALEAANEIERLRAFVSKLGQRSAILNILDDDDLTELRKLLPKEIA
jgi:hypothetical protein